MEEQDNAVGKEQDNTEHTTTTTTQKIGQHASNTSILSLMSFDNAPTEKPLVPNVGDSFAPTLSTEVISLQPILPPTSEARTGTAATTTTPASEVEQAESKEAEVISGHETKKDGPEATDKETEKSLSDATDAPDNIPDAIDATDRRET